MRQQLVVGSGGSQYLVDSELYTGPVNNDQSLSRFINT